MGYGAAPRKWKSDSHALDRLHVGELLIVYHSLCAAEHMTDRPPDVVGVEAKLVAAYARLAPSLGVTPQEDQAMRRCFGELAQGDDFRLAWVRLNAALEACRTAENSAPQPPPPRGNAVEAPLAAYNRVRRCKMCFVAWRRYYWSRRAGWPPAAAGAGSGVSLADLAKDPVYSCPIACSCILVFSGLGLAEVERRANRLPTASSRLRAGWVTAVVRGRYKTTVLGVWKRFANDRQLHRANAAARVEALGTARSGQGAFFAWNLWAWRKARKRWSVPAASRHARDATLSRQFQHWTRTFSVVQHTCNICM